MYKVISDDRGVFLVKQIESQFGPVMNCIAKGCDLRKPDETEKIFKDIADKLNK